MGGHEFLEGQVWAMPGGTPDHAAIRANVLALLHAPLRGKPCRVYGSDLRVRVPATGLGTYPDVTVICERFESDPDDPKGHTAVNPRVLVEVLSPPTEAYDRGEKLGHYQAIASLEEIVLVAHDRREVETHHRGADGAWARRAWREQGTARLQSLGCELPIVDVYADPLGTAGAAG